MAQAEGQLAHGARDLCKVSESGTIYLSVKILSAFNPPDIDAPNPLARAIYSRL
jgi:hypothetical protein